MSKQACRLIVKDMNSPFNVAPLTAKGILSIYLLCAGGMQREQTYRLVNNKIVGVLEATTELLI